MHHPPAPADTAVAGLLLQVHPHRNGKVYVSLTRADFMSLVSSCAAQYSYKISPSSEELKVACRCVEMHCKVHQVGCGGKGLLCWQCM